jgi:hypothetical protein
MKGMFLILLIFQVNLMGLDNTTSGRIMPIDNPLLELTKSNTSIKVYPNPATDYVTFEYKMPQFVENAQLTVTDLTGKVVKNIQLQADKGQILWDTRSVQNGLYLYVLKDEKGNTLISGKISIIK